MARFSDIGVRAAAGGAVLDLSGYHPIEHSIRECDDRVTHLRLLWSYRFEEALVGLLVGVPWRLTLCRVGRHWLLPTLDLEKGEYGSVCAWCEVRS